MRKRVWGFISLCLLPTWISATEWPPSTTPQEIVTAAPLVADGLLFVGSKERESHQGHLRAFALHSPLAGPLWDAADKIPLPGTGASPGDLSISDPPENPSVDNRVRSVYTNLPGAADLLAFTSASAAALRPEATPRFLSQ